jgi:hypothetical protein
MIFLQLKALCCSKGNKRNGLFMINTYELTLYSLMFSQDVITMHVCHWCLSATWLCLSTWPKQNLWETYFIIAKYTIIQVMVDSKNREKNTWLFSPSFVRKLSRTMINILLVQVLKSGHLLLSSKGMFSCKYVWYCINSLFMLSLFGAKWSYFV